jgi:hypothetical protein
LKYFLARNNSSFPKTAVLGKERSLGSFQKLPSSKKELTREGYCLKKELTREGYCLKRGQVLLNISQQMTTSEYTD